MKTLPKCLLLLLVAVVIGCSAGFAAAVETPQQGLLDTYRRIITRLETSNFGQPLYLESFEQDSRVHVDVYGIFTYPFSSIVDVLKVPATWCDIVSLPTNVKACTSREQAGAWLLTFYLGTKEYQPPQDSRQITCRYRIVDQQPGYLDILLNAEVGPFGTRDHRMRFEALPLDKDRTFIHVSYSYSDSAAFRLATKIYFATFGRGKVGFTVTGTDGDGDPVYIGGPRGAVERSAIRYYFAIQSFMDTLRNPQENRFNSRINEWYELTSHYRKQLFDLDKKHYLTSKAREHGNQVRLQQRLDAGLP